MKEPESRLMRRMDDNPTGAFFLIVFLICAVIGSTVVLYSQVFPSPAITNHDVWLRLADTAPCEVLTDPLNHVIFHGDLETIGDYSFRIRDGDCFLNVYTY